MTMLQYNIPQDRIKMWQKSSGGPRAVPGTRFLENGNTRSANAGGGEIVLSARFVTSHPTLPSHLSPGHSDQSARPARPLSADSAAAISEQGRDPKCLVQRREPQGVWCAAVGPAWTVWERCTSIGHARPASASIVIASGGRLSNGAPCCGSGKERGRYGERGGERRRNVRMKRT